MEQRKHQSCEQNTAIANSEDDLRAAIDTSLKLFNYLRVGPVGLSVWTRAFVVPTIKLILPSPKDQQRGGYDEAAHYEKQCKQYKIKERAINRDFRKQQSFRQQEIS